MTAGERNPQCWRSECRVACYYPEVCVEAKPPGVTAGGAEGLRAGVEALIARAEARRDVERRLVTTTALRALLAAQSGPEVVGDEEAGDPVNEAMKETWRNPPPNVSWTYEPCAREHTPGRACILEEGHAPSPAEPRGDAAGLEAVLAGHAFAVHREPQPIINSAPWRMTEAVWGCTCGWVGSDKSHLADETPGDTHRAHVAAVIVEAGWKR